MTKQQEINALKQFTASIPQDSYLRPWLESVLPEVEQEIRSDFPVSPSLTETRRSCATMLADAKRQGEAIITMAKEKAEATEQASLKFAGKVRSNLHQAICQAEKQLLNA